MLDTGIMYRALTWIAIENDLDLEDQSALEALAQQTDIHVSDDGDEIIANGYPVPLEQHRVDIDSKVSLVAAIPEVREAMVRIQRELARYGRIVVIGRDIGTVVIPNAPLKLFLVASSRERALRRYRELIDLNYDVDRQKIIEDLKVRDHIDSERPHSPLKPAADSVTINTDGVSVEMVVEKILRLIKDM